jgi:predicted aconitase with swiveling domain
MKARPLIPGAAQGELLVSPEPISFWGGYDQHSGEIIDRRHPLSGQMAAGKVLAVPFSRGSSTTTAVLLEAILNETAPAALITRGVDSFFALAAVVAEEVFQKTLPVVALEPSDFDALQSGGWLTLAEDGTITLTDGPDG